jgi:GWxTD domain-containing protein
MRVIFGQTHKPALTRALFLGGLLVSELLMIGPPARAQSSGRPSSAELYTAGQQRLSRGDTTEALKAFELAVRHDKTNAAAWYAIGRVASETTRRWWRANSMPAGVPQRMLLADSAFALAIVLEPDSVLWYASFADYLFSAHHWDMARAMRILNAGIASSERTAQTAQSSTLANRLGLFWWRRYEAIANRSVVLNDLQHDMFVTRWYAYPDFLKDVAQKLDPPTGVANFETAYGYFLRAFTLDPDDELAFRHLGMALVEQGRWAELTSIARRAIARNDTKAWPHLALGLALHRTGAMDQANESFDRGFALLPADVAANLLAIQRVTAPTRTAARTLASVGPRDTSSSTSANSSFAQERFAATFWGAANPSLLIPGNAVYTEFRARVVHAELRWTNEETGRHGVDSDRGDVFIRWGPPDNISNFRPDPLGAIEEGWLYRRNRFTIFFSAMPTFGTAYMQPLYRSNVYDVVVRDFPAAWNNLDIARRGQFDIPITAFRFRGGVDSLQTALWAVLPVGELHVTAAETPGATVPPSRGRTTVQVTGLDAMWQRTATQRRADTTLIVDSTTSTVMPVVLSAPPGTEYLRVDALSEIASTGERRVAKGTIDLRNDMGRGFAISDLVVTRALREKDPALPPRRWSDVAFAPLPNRTITKGEPLSVLWEVYEPTVRDGQARYRVAVHVERRVSRGVRAVAAKVLGGILGTNVQIESSGRRSISYDRTIAPTTVALEQLRLDLGNVDAGDYAVALTVTDGDTQRVVTRSYNFTIVKAK